MNVFRRQQSPLDKRLTALDKELAVLHRNMKKVADNKNGQNSFELPKEKKQNDDSDSQRNHKRELVVEPEDEQVIGDDRFANYFTAGHFPNLRPLRYERRIARNRALFLLGAVAIVVLCLILFFKNS
ncbi:MAG: hypothetical protein GX811_10245 [Lentisphaerae bacterium]|nr:hypothetical protein [Lentisphaerota bacterium]